MRPSSHRALAYRLQSLTLASLVLYLTFPLLGLHIEPLKISQVMAQSPKAGKTEADRLLKQGEELRDRNQSQAALEAFQQALKIYRQIKNRQGEGRALKNIGSAYDDLGDSKQATTYYQQALEIAQAINDTDLEARLLSNLGLVYLDLGNTQRATEYCQKALAVARQSQNHETEAIALKSLAAIYIGSNNIEKSLDFLEQALVAIRQANGSPEDKLRQRRLELRLLDAGGDLYYALGTTKINNKDKTGHELLNKALQDYQQALTIAQQIGDRSRQGKALLAIGDVYYIKADSSKVGGTQTQYFKKAIEILQQALQMLKADKTSRSQVRKTYTKLGDIYHRSGQLKQGLDSYQEALKMIQTEVSNNPLQKLENNVDQGWILVSSGNIYTDSGKFQKAVESYDKAIEILESSLKQAQSVTSPGKKFSLTRINSGLQLSYIRKCFAYKRLGRFDEGIEACQKSENYKVLKKLLIKN